MLCGWGDVCDQSDVILELCVNSYGFRSGVVGENSRW